MSVSVTPTPTLWRLSGLLWFQRVACSAAGPYKEREPALCGSAQYHTLSANPPVKPHRSRFQHQPRKNRLTYASLQMCYANMLKQHCVLGRYVTLGSELSVCAYERKRCFHKAGAAAARLYGLSNKQGCTRLPEAPMCERICICAGICVCEQRV